MKIKKKKRIYFWGSLKASSSELVFGGFRGEGNAICLLAVLPPNGVVSFLLQSWSPFATLRTSDTDRATPRLRVRRVSSGGFSGVFELSETVSEDSLFFELRRFGFFDLHDGDEASKEDLIVVFSDLKFL